MLKVKTYGDKNNQAIVLIHGYLSSHEHFKFQIEELIKNDFCVYCIDMPGHGLNKELLLPSMTDFAKAMIETINSLELGRFSLLGHSMGGMLVIEIAVTISNQIDKLICYGTAASGNFENRFETIEESKIRVKNDYASFKKMAHAKWFYTGENDKYFNLSFDSGKGIPIESAINSLDVMKNFTAKNRISNIKNKTLIIYGDSDKTYGMKDILFLKDNINNSQLCVLPACGHSPHLEKVELFNKILIDFLKNK
jgi:pimeloyl-ACP methyl ester carboxylesterase